MEEMIFQNEGTPPPPEDQAIDDMLGGGSAEGMIMDQPAATTEGLNMGGLTDDPYDQPNSAPVNGFMQPPEVEETLPDSGDNRLFASPPANLAFGVQESGPYQEWMKTNLERLAEKTKKESEEIAVQRTQAAEEIEKFYAEREAKLGAKRQQNREDNQSSQKALESSLQKGGWASITEVFCDLKSDTKADTSRLKEILVRKKARESAAAAATVL